MKELSDDVTRLRRWEDFGATWRVLGDFHGTLTISLCRCDGGEEQEQLTSDDPALIAYVAGRMSNFN